MQLSELTSRIAGDFLLFTQRGLQNKNCITAEEYILFRQQAMQEIAGGFASEEMLTEQTHIPVLAEAVEQLPQPVKPVSERKKEVRGEPPVSTEFPKENDTPVETPSDTSTSNTMLNLLKNFKED